MTPPATPAPPRLRPAQDSDLLAIGWLLACAFDEPATRWLIPDRARHDPVLNAFFEVLAGDALTDGAVDLLVDEHDEPVAAAVWFDQTTPPAHADVPAQRDPRLDRILGPDTPRWHTLDQVMTAAHPTTAHHYLFAVGVRPDLQGHGLGSRLLQAGHDRIAPAPAYLEATSARSRRLYLRHRYTDLGPPLQLPDGPPLWPMWRSGDATRRPVTQVTPESPRTP